MKIRIPPDIEEILAKEIPSDHDVFNVKLWMGELDSLPEVVSHPEIAAWMHKHAGLICEYADRGLFGSRYFRVRR